MRRRRLSASVPLDEQQQEELIDGFKLKAANQEVWFRSLFSVLVLLPTPAYVALPYCRTQPALSLVALIACAAAAYALKFKRPFIAKIDAALAFTVALRGWLHHWPWSGHDFLWAFPTTAAVTVIVLEYWFSQVSEEIAALQAVRYNLRGA